MPLGLTFSVLWNFGVKMPQVCHEQRTPDYMIMPENKYKISKLEEEKIVCLSFWVQRWFCDQHRPILKLWNLSNRILEENLSKSMKKLLMASKIPTGMVFFDSLTTSYTLQRDEKGGQMHFSPRTVLFSRFLWMISDLVIRYSVRSDRIKGTMQWQDLFREESVIRKDGYGCKGLS